MGANCAPMFRIMFIALLAADPAFSWPQFSIAAPDCKPVFLPRCVEEYVTYEDAKAYQLCADQMANFRRDVAYFEVCLQIKLNETVC